MDKGAKRTTVHGVIKSWTQLSDWAHTLLCMVAWLIAPPPPLSECLILSSQSTPSRTGLQMWTPSQLTKISPFPSPSTISNSSSRWYSSVPLSSPWWKVNPRCHMSTNEPLFLSNFTKTHQGSQLVLGAWLHLPPEHLWDWCSALNPSKLAHGMPHHIINTLLLYSFRPQNIQN